MAHERLAELRVIRERLLVKPRSFSNLPAFSDLHGRKTDNSIQKIVSKICRLAGRFFRKSRLRFRKAGRLWFGGARETH